MTRKKPSVRDVTERPAYSVGEAAHYLRMSPMTLQSWALGRTYPTASGIKRWQPLFDIADKRGRRLSFINLVEANVLAAVRRDHGVAMPKVRAALDFVRAELDVARPLADEKFETDGVSLFVKRYGELINASQSGQRALRGMLDAALQRIERSAPDGVPVRLYARGPTDAAAPSRFVAFDPNIAFGRPILVTSGVPVAAIAGRFRGGDTIHFLAEDYGVGAEAIEEALRQAELLRAA